MEPVCKLARPKTIPLSRQDGERLFRTLQGFEYRGILLVERPRDEPKVGRMMHGVPVKHDTLWYLFFRERDMSPRREVSMTQAYCVSSDRIEFPDTEESVRANGEYVVPSKHGGPATITELYQHHFIIRHHFGQNSKDSPLPFSLETAVWLATDDRSIRILPLIFSEKILTVYKHSLFPGTHVLCAQITPVADMKATVRAAVELRKLFLELLHDPKLAIVLSTKEILAAEDNLRRADRRKLYAINKKERHLLAEQKIGSLLKLVRKNPIYKQIEDCLADKSSKSWVLAVTDPPASDPCFLVDGSRDPV